MRDEHLSTILETESVEVIKFSVENLVPISCESEVTSDNESECDVPYNDESSLIFTTFSNPIFDCNDDSTSSDDKSLSNEDVPMENLKIYLSSLFDDEEIIPTKIDPHYFNVESNRLESLLNRDTLIDSSPKFDYFLEEFSDSIRVKCMPSNEIKEFVQLGFGQAHMGRSGRGLGNCSSVCEVHSFGPSGDFEIFTLLVPGLCLLSFEGLGIDLLIQSVCYVCRPMRYMGFASWDLDKVTWGGRVGLFGTVQVVVRCTGKA
nr:hypothetical protein [Tanacetum cinerariifolium]